MKCVFSINKVENLTYTYTITCCDNRYFIKLKFIN